MERFVPYDATQTALYRPQDAHISLLASDRNSIRTLCSECSRLVYKKFEANAAIESEIRNTLATVGFSICEFFTCKRAHAFAALSPSTSTALLAFRGTQANNWTDLRTNLEAKLISCAMPGLVHEGFWRAIDTICGETQIVQWLEGNRAQTTVFTGHSLGAALATLAAARFPQAEVIAFGSPRVGNRDFANALSAQKIVRYVDCCDIVCRLAPEPMGYVHVGDAVYLDRNGLGKGAVDDKALSYDRAAARASYLFRYAWRQGNVWVRDLADHAPVNYVSAVRYASAQSAL
jgi:triacylglycerol lipase